MPKTVTYLNPPGAPAPLGLYHNVAIAEPGRLAFIAGQVAVDAQGEIVGPHDVGAQTPVVLENIGLILKDLGVDRDLAGDEGEAAGFGDRDVAVEAERRRRARWVQISDGLGHLVSLL